MLDQSRESLFLQTVEILNTACQGSLALLESLEAGQLQAADRLLGDLRMVVQAVEKAERSFSERLEHAYIKELLDNVTDTLEDIQRSLAAGDSERAAMKTEFQFYPFFCLLWGAFYFWVGIQPDAERMEQYYREEFAAHHSNPYFTGGQAPELRLSVVIPAYNHLETTKKCVEQLLKVTDFEKLNAELILLDHGSTDGTLEYFESLGVGKVIHFKHNVRMYMFALMARVCRGEYFAFVSNDVLVTKDWAEILLNCLDSDPQIIAAVPATPNIANYQMLHVPTNDPEEFVVWANGQNRADPSRWNDRARLMPPLGCYRTAAVSEIGFADPYFYSMEFWDDDFSLRARRNGYRQVVCDDVACYHFGSVTGKEAQKKEGTLGYGHELFLKKNGVDAWGNGFCYDYDAVQLIMSSLPPKDRINLLAIDCGLGDTPLQIRNELRHQQKECRITNLTCQRAYIPDLEPLSDEFRFTGELEAALTGELAAEKYDCIYVSRDISKYPDFKQLLRSVHGCLADGGICVFTCANPHFVLTIDALLNLSMPKGADRLCLMDPNAVLKNACELFPSVQPTGMTREVGGVWEFAQSHCGGQADLPRIVKRLSVEKYYFVCQK